MREYGVWERMISEKYDKYLSRDTSDSFKARLFRDEKLKYKIFFVNRYGKLKETIGTGFWVGKYHEVSWYDIKENRRIFINVAKYHGREEYIPKGKGLIKNGR